MVEDAKRLGELFKARRKELGLSLREIESSTSIRTGYLEAIEEGRVEKFLSSVYMYGFMRQYANFLGMDVEALSREHPGAFRKGNEKHDFAYGIGTLEMRSSIGNGIKWLPNLLWASGFALVLLLAWFLARHLGIL